MGILLRIPMDAYGFMIHAVTLNRHHPSGVVEARERPPTVWPCGSYMQHCANESWKTRKKLGKNR